MDGDRHLGRDGCHFGQSHESGDAVVVAGSPSPAAEFLAISLKIIGDCRGDRAFRDFTPVGGSFPLLSPRRIAFVARESMFMDLAIANFLSRILLFIPQLGLSLLIFGAFWFASILSRKLILRFAHRVNLNIDILNLLEQTTKISLLFFGALTALGTLGIDVSALVAGLGLTGFALGLALKDIVSNLLSGVLILIYQPFRRNDWIKVGPTEGKVLQIDLRYTTLQADNQKILIPNSSLFTNTICIIDKEEKIKIIQP